MVRLFPEKPQRPRKSGGSGTRNYASRRIQYQLTALVFSLMLVLLTMQEAAKPKNWTWLWRTAADPSSETASGTSKDLTDGTLSPSKLSQADSEVDTRLADDAASDSLDDPTIVAPAQLPAREQGTLPHVPGYLPGIDPERFLVIRDDTLFRREEIPIWYEMLESLAVSSDEMLTHQGAEKVGFVQLYRQPNVYRGKLVQIAGTVHRATYIHDQGGHAKVPGYWQCWIQPTGTTYVIVVYSLAMPNGFPAGDQLQEEVQFTGLFYKRWAYMAVDGMRSAPLVLARRGTWSPTAGPSPTRLPSPPQLMIVVASLATVAIGVAWWVMRASSSGSTIKQTDLIASLDVERLLQADSGIEPIGLTIEKQIVASNDDTLSDKHLP